MLLGADQHLTLTPLHTRHLCLAVTCPLTAANEDSSNTTTTMLSIPYLQNLRNHFRSWGATTLRSSGRNSPRPREMLRHLIHTSRLRIQAFGIPGLTYPLAARGCDEKLPLFVGCWVRDALEANARVNNMESSADRALLRMDFPKRIGTRTPSTQHVSISFRAYREFDDGDCVR